MPGIMGKKIGMTQIFQEDGKVIPVTVIQTSPNEVIQVKTNEKDGYTALVLGFEPLSKPRKTKKFRYLREFPLVGEKDAFEKGAKINLDIFAEGESVRLTGVSKGKGFAGVMKRWNFHGGPGSHGSHAHREPGSVGQRAKPGRIEKGKKLPGHLGVDRVTLDCKLIFVDKEKNLLGVKGAVPGAINGLVILKKKFN